MPEQPRYPKGDPRGGQFAPKTASEKLGALKQAAVNRQQAQGKGSELSLVTNRKAILGKLKAWDEKFAELKVLDDYANCQRGISGTKRALETADKLPDMVGASKAGMLLTIEERRSLQLSGYGATVPKDQIKSTLEQRLESLNRRNQELEPVIKERGWGSVNMDHYLDNKTIGGLVKEADPEYAMMGIADKKGNIQSAALYSMNEDHLYVDFLSTAPWNVVGGDERQTKGAGAKAISELVKISQSKGKGGRVKLYPTVRATPFYEHLGFKEGENGDMELTPEAAEKLVKKYG